LASPGGWKWPWREFFRIEIAFLNELGGTRIGENLGVARLVVVGGVRIRHQDRRLPADRDLGEAGCAGPRDDQIRHGVGGGHLIAETEHLVVRAAVGDL
jgi:hypothetical protein